MNPSNIHNFGSVDRLILGLAFEMSQGRDVYMTNELTRHLFQTPGHHYGMDLASLNIQRGRDHGLPSYNIWREQCGLHRFTNWGELLQVMDDDTVGRLAAVYR
ncbi:Thyroid peroxidase [Portunus trituberculatus]|uniref:Thyroid peroxidase n=2 Tax=Portuninae TaxID=600346 RepID=A0A5B7CU81_PORTR|nr:Thyroid peroxidase [Portunus trituberculatus]